jgi:replicative DNA helicase
VKTEQRLDFIVAKNRSGPCGRVDVTFHKPVMTFRQTEKGRAA